MTEQDSTPAKEVTLESAAIETLSRLSSLLRFIEEEHYMEKSEAKDEALYGIKALTAGLGDYYRLF